MTDQGLPPATNVTDMYLAAIRDELRALRDLLAPKKAPVINHGTIELRGSGATPDPEELERAFRRNLQGNDQPEPKRSTTKAKR